MEEKVKRLSQAAKELNVSVDTIVKHLSSKYQLKVESNPNAKITIEQFNLLSKDFESSIITKKEARNLNIGKSQSENIIIKSTPSIEKKKEEEEKEIFIKNAFFIDSNKDKNPFSQKKNEEKPKPEPEVIKAKLPGLKVLDKIDLNSKKQPIKNEEKIAPIVNKPVENTVIEAKEVESKQTEQKVVQEKTVKTEEVNVEGKNLQSETSPLISEQKVNPQEIQTPMQEVIKTKTDTTAEHTQHLDLKITKEQQQTLLEKDIEVEQNLPIVQHSSNDEMLQKTAPVLEEDTEYTDTTHMEKNLVVENDLRKTTTVSDILKSAKLNKKKGQEPIDEDAPVTEEKNELIEAKADALPGLKILGKIELPDPRMKKKPKPVASSDDHLSKEKRKRKRKRKERDKGVEVKALTPDNQVKKEDVKKENTNNNRNNNNNNNNKNSSNNNNQAKTNRHNNNNNSGNNNNNRNKVVREEISEKEIQEKIKNTLALLNTSTKGSKQAVGRKQKKEKLRSNFARNQELLQQEKDKKVLQVTEFISANDLATLLGVSVNEVISKCLSFGMFIAINQRLDAEAITFIADEFGYEVEFISAEEETSIQLEQEDKEEDLVSRAPIVTIMGHVDHGKTSLLDYIRKTNVTQGEAGGITQHIGAYDVVTSSGKRITFLDTPGHEAFTAMRARGAKVTDIAVIVIAADDSVMPQTVEAINHAQVAGVPMVFAINKIDKPDANPNKIKEALANMNILVEDWGGKYQCQELSAKKGIGVEDLLEKILLEAEFLDLKANPKKNATGTVIEASLDKGKGYLATVLVQSGTLKIGDMVLAGSHYGKVKAMLDYRGNKLTKAGPSMPVQILGLNGAPQAGDKFNVTTEREAKEIATRREQLLREQGIRAIKRTTLNELGRRIALGFKQLNIIVKADVDGSVEALSDSLLKLSKEEVEVRIIHKGVGQISEADVTLATTADAIIIGFQVRPSANARKLADKESVEIRLYSIIYDAINDVKDALEGMLAPTIEEVILGNAEVREVFKISKVGTVAGCYITEGVIKRNSKVRLIRDGIVIYGGGESNNGEISALKRFKDDVSEVKTGFECGISLKNFNNIQIGDIIEAYEQKEVKRKL
ncbi:translation initiation factor IF-2 [Thermoflexibacter ruber]|uniref:Translation initiation factor IF-2 n=1 Tax=Thermoflexibacter ruber TaxID=1003 RepID=A0A1I2A684_9BACT|nr:translation initiation factor IF-2 [Thermoflexibacter ruber]SFE38290.1 bacterial translation initiation factor 2 (bIF-2) [Thermoflexibacter ruber]